ncbi:MAG TPA: hypothetical protein VLH18_05860 [Candidatus Limnocylindrales bacterium]|nr:hypothetical protein [Candidatus Limnocylindrales bacterium]
MSIFNDIETAMHQKAKAAGLSIKFIELSDDDDLDTIERVPAVNFSIRSGKGHILNSSTERFDIDIYATVLVKHEKAEDARRKLMNPLLQGIIGLFVGNGLSVTRPDTTVENIPLKKKVWCKGFQQVRQTKNGLAYVIQFSTVVDIAAIDQEEAEGIISVALDEVYKPGDNTEDLSAVFSQEE